MDRRAFIGGLALAAAPRAAKAQPPGKVYRVGLATFGIPLAQMSGPQPADRSVRAFVQGLRALGYVEGQNLILDRRSSEGRGERPGDIVAELIRLKPDVIVTNSNSMARQAKAVTRTVLLSWRRAGIR